MGHPPERWPEHRRSTAASTVPPLTLAMQQRRSHPASAFLVVGRGVRGYAPGSLLPGLRGPLTPAESSAALAALGRGGKRDRVSLSLTLVLLRRCLSLLRPIRKQLLLFFAGFSALALVFVPLGVLLFDAFWTRALQGQPLHGWRRRCSASTRPCSPSASRSGAASGTQVLERVIVFGIAFGARGDAPRARASTTTRSGSCSA